MKVELWDMYEIELKSSKFYNNPFTDVVVTGRFTHEGSDEKFSVSGFYDGDSTWRIRFMPLKTGEWRYSVVSSDSGMDGKEGRLDCVAPSAPYLHGPLKTRGEHFFYADGSPCFLISTRVSCHLSPPEVWKPAVKYLKEHGINRIFFMMGGVMGTTGCLFKEENDFSAYNIETFRSIDTFIDELRHSGIIASPYFYYFNDGIQCNMSIEEDKAYISYGMARFGAYSNVMPVLSNEVESKYVRDREGIRNHDLRSHKWCEEIGPFLSEHAVFGVPVSIHNPMEHFGAINPGFYTLLQDWPFKWASCMLRQAQVGALGAIKEIRDDTPESKRPEYNSRGYARHNELLVNLKKFGIPVINEEPGYEMAGYRDNGEYIPRSWNSQNPDTILATFWTALMAGAYAMWGHFDTYEMGDPLPGIKRTITPKYLKILRDFVENLPFWEMSPSNEIVSPSEELYEEVPYRTNFCLAKKGEVYVIFSLNGGKLELSLVPEYSYYVVQFDPRTGRQLELGIIEGARQLMEIAGKEQVLLLTRK